MINSIRLFGKLVDQVRSRNHFPKDLYTTWTTGVAPCWSFARMHVIKKKFIMNTWSINALYLRKHAFIDK